MKIRWLGTASVEIESNGTRLLFDPYMRHLSRELPAFPREALAEANAIFITHPHLDHFADIKEVLSETAAPVYVCPRGLRNAPEQAERLTAIAAGDRINVGGMTVTAYQARHCVFDAKTILSVLGRGLGRRFVPLAKVLRQHLRFGIGEKDIYAYRISDGERNVILFGSAGMDENEKYPEEADLAVWPYQGRSDMYLWSVPMLRRLKPKKVMLTHFDDAFPPMSSDVDCGRMLRDKRFSAFQPRFGYWYRL